MASSHGEGPAVAFNEILAERVRVALADAPDLYERLMFGGIAFMVSGHMACGVVDDELMLRLGPEGAELALDQPHVRPMDFTGRPMRSMVFVGPQALRDDRDLERWVSAAAGFVATLPPKPLR
jgi:TfoX/Sxy family transcriptional regulator of competence genes